ncbi:MAG: low-specificity L-threonine aldolase [Deltaproteobacteria bacterium]|nr:low-specificity L-threonine aldolase [Deltaproteobacteria bacterium]
MIDLRSDTVTLPSPAMREAMYRAELGDDVVGEDPTVNRLEALAAELTGKEAAVLVVSGTMGNLISLFSHCRRGDEAILGDQSHIFNYEAGGASVLGGIVFHPVATGRLGNLDVAAIANAIRPAATNLHFAPPGVICLESTHNRCGGTILPINYFRSVRALADHASIPVHLDGSRIFNAAVALGCDVREFTSQVDSVQFCLSKGLAAPVGSLVCGSRELIARARRWRKMVGGGMRQAGIIAAAGIVALTEMIDRLAEDHRTARVLAEGVADLPGMQLDVETVQTNLVIFGPQTLPPEGPSFAQALARAGVHIGDLGGGRFRAVTHYGITLDDIHSAVQIVRNTWREVFRS